MALIAELEEDRRIARRLPRTWPTFFEAFGRLTPVQRAAIPTILEGHDVLLVSATATGKTEAACAPLVERLIDSQERWTERWTILYICPTRALVNDLYERLWAPLHRLSLSVKRRTGDHKERVEGAHVLLTTPESFDSLLCRGRTGSSGHVLAHVAAVVLDEIHLLNGTARGEQVRWLMERLRRLRREAKVKGWARRDEFQTVALSATVSEPEAIVASYLRGGRTIQLEGGRQIETVAPPEAGITVDEALPSYVRSLRRPEKILVFSNTRRRVDDLAAGLRPPLQALGYDVRAHHGSLDRREREACEEALRTADKIVVFSTSTLELGIDIGDIDLVVLDGPAPDVMALLQRIGRGNRRTNVTRVMACSGSLLEAIVHSAMIEAARDGWLGPAEHGPQYAVARQQVASYIFQSGRRSRSRTRVQSLLDSCSPPVVATALIEAMLASGEIEEDESGLRLGADWLQKQSTGAIHSTIEEMPGVDVVDEETGQRIVKGLSFQAGKGLRAGGLLLEARKWSERKLEVRRVRMADAAQGDWGYTSRRWIKGPGQPQTVRRYLCIDDETWPVVESGGRRYVFHFGGARRQAVIQLAAQTADRPHAGIVVNEWYLSLPDRGVRKPRWIDDASPWRIELAIGAKLDSLENTLGRPRANKWLPMEARIDEVKRWLFLEDELRTLQEATWSSETDGDVAAVLRDLVGVLERS
jgi:ATP-dependent Lhr-like helicase